MKPSKINTSKKHIVDNKTDLNKNSEYIIDKYRYTFECLLAEYNDIIANGRSIDTKAGLFLTLLFVILPFYIQVIDIDFLKNICNFDPPTTSKYFFIFFFVVSMVSYAITFLFYVFALYPRPFDKLTNDTKKLSDYYYIENEFLRSSLIKDYQIKIHDLSSYIGSNIVRSHKKSDWFKRALISFVIYSVLIILVIFLKLFLKF